MTKVVGGFGELSTWTADHPLATGAIDRINVDLCDDFMIASVKLNHSSSNCPKIITTKGLRTGKAVGTA